MFKKVLVPLDGSPLAECSLTYVKHLMQNTAVHEVILINIVLNNFDWHAQKEDFDFKTFRENLFLTSNKYLEDIKNRFNFEGTNIKTESIEGSFAAQAITDYAKKNSVDIIVMSTHGLTGKKILMFGSTALSVLHDSYVPVLLVRPESCRS